MCRCSSYSLSPQYLFSFSKSSALFLSPSSSDVSPASYLSLLLNLSNTSLKYFLPMTGVSVSAYAPTLKSSSSSSTSISLYCSSLSDFYVLNIHPPESLAGSGFVPRGKAAAYLNIILLMSWYDQTTTGFLLGSYTSIVPFILVWIWQQYYKRPLSLTLTL